MSESITTQLFDPQQIRTLVRAHQDHCNALTTALLKTLNEQLHLIVVGTPWITWENTQEHDDNGYFDMVSDVCLHFSNDEEGKNTLDFGDLSDIQNGEWRAEHTLPEFHAQAIEQAEDYSQEYNQRLAELFSERYCYREIRSLDNLSNVLELIDTIIELAIEHDSNQTSSQILDDEAAQNPIL